MSKFSAEIKIYIFSALTFLLTFNEKTNFEVKLWIVKLNVPSTLIQIIPVLMLIYYLWECYQYWIEEISLKDEIDDALCDFLTQHLIQKIKKLGPEFCTNNETRNFSRYDDLGNIFSSDSRFIYLAKYKKYGKDKYLKTFISIIDDFGNEAELGHVAHIFPKDEISKLAVKCWITWAVKNSFFRLRVLPLIFAAMTIIYATWNIF